MNWTIHQKIDLHGRYKQHFMMADVLLVPGNNEGHVWEIEVNDKGVPADLSGYAVKAQFVRDDGSVVTINSGTISGNVASIKFAEGCYVIPGLLRGVVTLTKNSKPVSICETHFIVRETLNGNGTIIIPSDEIVYTPTRQIVYDNRKFMDVSDTTATVDDVRQGKTFYGSDGVKKTGVGDYSVTFGSNVSVVLVSGDDYRFEFS